MGIKIVRALWGNIDKFLEDIKQASTDNTIVMVWGSSNLELLSSLGFECKLLSVDDMSSVDDSDMYHLKLVAMHEAATIYKQILFLDWDTKPIKEMDDNFYQMFFGKRWCAPLYCYPSNLSQYAKTDIEVKWGAVIDGMMNKHSWKKDGYNILPMAGLIFVSSPVITNQLLDIYKNFKLKGLIEEFALYELANCSLGEYIDKFEPICIRGRESKNKFSFGSYDEYTYIDLNNYIEKVHKKDCYFIHE